jgi:uncharacterized phiE125 gp8 family phage protein
MFEPTIITDASTEPISVAELKSAQRIDSSDEDTLMGIYIGAARKWIEKRTGRTFHEQTLEMKFDRWQERFILPRATPLISVTGLYYTDSDEDESTVSSADYIADTSSIPGRIVRGYGVSWPSTTLSPSLPIRIRYTAGIETQSPITEADDHIKTAMMLFAGGLFLNRESESLSPSQMEVLAYRYGLGSFLEQMTLYYE